MNQAKHIEDQLLDEEEVISRSRLNSAEFRPLYERYYPSIFRFLLKRIGDKEYTADVCSQVFLKALVNLSQFTYRGLPFSAWLYRIAVNECNDYFRKAKRVRMVVIDDSMANHLYEEMFSDEFRKDLLEKLPALMQRLRHDELNLIELRFLEGRSFREVSDIIGITENNAKVKTYRILEKMRKWIQPEVKGRVPSTREVES